MFNLMKKDKEKELEKKEKKDRKDKKERMSQAELKSLEEMSIRRGFFNLNRGSTKRESKTRLEISGPIPIKVVCNTELNLTDLGTNTSKGQNIEHISACENVKISDQEHSRNSVKEKAAKFEELVSSGPRYTFQKPTKVVIPELVEKTFSGVDLQLPSLIPPPVPDPRNLELQRRSTGDFGFSLRRSTMLDRQPDGKVCRRVVHFAEPGAGTKERALGLVPGDRLLEINGMNVENKNRDEIVEMIRQSGDVVCLKVQPIVELSELNRIWMRSTEELHKDFNSKTEEQITAEKAWYNTEKVWLVHKDGFSMATLLKTEAGSLPEGKVKIRLESDGSLLDVDEDDVEKANPPLFDRVEDLASLQYLNESSVMHSLRQRHGANLVHTHAGPSMVVINPISAPSMYSEKVMQMFKGCKREDTAPHIYSMAQTAYRNLLTTRQDQSIVLLGKSGSGKTTNCQHIIQYLMTVAGCTNKSFSSEKWQAVYTVLEAFGNASTCLNGNASRFSHIVSLDFDQSGQVTSASIQTMLLEKARVTRRPEGESTFNVFYYLMAGVESSLRTELHLNHFSENNAFGIMPQARTEDKQRASQQFSKLQAAMKVLGISPDEQRAFWLVLGAIYHLGSAGATKAGRKQFARHEWAQKAAYLLGCTLEELSSSIFKHQAKGTLPRASASRQTPDENGGGDAGSKTTALECLEAMASGLYSELFTILISMINRALKSSQHSLCSLLIVDTPGLQNPRMAKRECGATFEDLCHNYTQERLQTLFYQRNFVQELERYKEENIELALDDTGPSTSMSVAVVDQASSQALVRTGRTDEARGLLWLMEEEALQPGGSEQTLLGRLFSYYGPAEGESKGHTFLLKSEKDHHFLLGHSHGTDWVEYNTHGWLNYAKHNPATSNAACLMQDSQKKIISSLIMSRAGGATVLSGSVAGLEAVSQLSLRRATSMRKTFTTGMAAIKKKSLCIQIKLQVDALLDMVRRSKIHFVHCILPKADALKALSGSLFKGGECETQGENSDPGLMQLDVALLRAQLRGSKLLDALRIYRQGYPDHMVFSEFRRRFDVLAPHLSKKHGRNYIVKDEKRAVEELLSPWIWRRAATTWLFFRAGTLAKLEEQRDEQTKRNIILFQAASRGYLARQAFKKRKIQDLAIRCIQKNIKKNHGVKDWPWWKLFTTVQPLIRSS
ncbi:hypothetical protein WMY93_007362 [Mugilogobius chulae]|uniref:Myosin XVIIIAa n=1 Tax=Mugilogobius chulae TaxID=88201 RepID=A0AAW0PFU0_9GOBI